MSIKLSTKWYIAFASVLTAIGTFLVTTDPVFHYGEMFKSSPIDTTKIVTSVPTLDIDSLARVSNDELPPTIRQLSRKQKVIEQKVIEHDTLIHKRILGDK